jgi:hypothetical protein
LQGHRVIDPQLSRLRFRDRHVEFVMGHDQNP